MAQHQRQSFGGGSGDDQSPPLNLQAASGSDAAAAALINPSSDGSQMQSILADPKPCQVEDCGNSSAHIIRRKWYFKMRKQIARLLHVNVEPSQSTGILFCVHHYNVIGHLMVCTLCKRKLVRNHIYYITQVS